MAAIPADVFVGRGEVVESRPNVAEFIGPFVSLLDATVAESDFLVHGAVAGMVPESVYGGGVGGRAGDSVSDFCAAEDSEIRGVVFAGVAGTDFFDGELYFFQFIGDG